VQGSLARDGALAAVRLASRPMPSPERLSVVDIGSNTANCAVYASASTGALDRVAESSEPLKLMRRIGPDGSFPPGAVERVLAVLRGFKDFSRAHGASRVICLATSAVRDARNAGEIVRAARRDLGLTLRVIDGEEEGQLAARSVLGLLPVRNGLVLDLGGGSAQLTEIVAGEARRVASLPLGALRLTDRFGTQDVAPADQVLALRAHVDGVLAAAPWIAEVQGTLVGVGGTIRALGKVDRRARPGLVSHGHGYALAREAVEQCWEWMSRVDAERRRSIPGLPGHRVETIVAGALVVARVLALRGDPKICVNSYGVREGAALQAWFGDGPGPADAPLRAELQARWPDVPASLPARIETLLDADGAPANELALGVRIAAWCRAAGVPLPTLLARPVHGATHADLLVARDLLAEGPPLTLALDVAEQLRGSVRGCAA
jgi:exopolyphosphatase/pppGpp-phosphohydrolase